jgi:hypothetical protein
LEDVGRPAVVVLAALAVVFLALGVAFALVAVGVADGDAGAGLTTSALKGGLPRAGVTRVATPVLLDAPWWMKPVTLWPVIRNVAPPARTANTMKTADPRAISRLRRLCDRLTAGWGAVGVLGR